MTEPALKLSSPRSDEAVGVLGGNEAHSDVGDIKAASYVASQYPTCGGVREGGKPLLRRSIDQGVVVVPSSIYEGYKSAGVSVIHEHSVSVRSRGLRTVNQTSGRQQ